MIIYADKLLDWYSDLCLNKINERNLYDLISEIQYLITLDKKVEKHIGVLYDEFKYVKKMINSDNLSDCITGVHAFFQLHHSHNLSLGIFILIYLEEDFYK